MFQSTLPRGERPLRVAVVHRIGRFQSTLPRGERPRGSNRNRLRQTCFNPRSRAGSDQALLDSNGGVFRVSIHAPARGATSSSSPLPHAPRSFNPRSRAGSDAAGLITNAPRLFQSTLPRGERRSYTRCKRQRFWVSIHAPARGATAGNNRLNASDLFQSTLPRGERLLLRREVGEDTDVSIHAPARGATICPPRVPAVSMFQSTLPRGERRWSTCDATS